MIRKKETVLITGASSGLGLELAELFAADGSDLVLVARRAELLEQIAERLRTRFGIRATAVPADLTAPDGVQRMVAAVEEMGLEIDVLVNSAGFGAHGEFARLPVDRVVAMVELNVTALTHLTRCYLPGMIQRGRGGIVNLGSLAGFLPGPHMATYFASKAYVLAFSEALQEEVRGTGVTVCCIAPGPTHTDFVETAGMQGIRFFRFGAKRAPDVARIGYRDFRAGRAISLPGFATKSAAIALRFSPRALTRRVSRYLNVRTG